MDPRLLDIVLCPVCEGTLDLVDTTVKQIQYQDGVVEEVERGYAVCTAGHRYPISDFVLSFADVFSPELGREAAFWNGYYGWLLEQGSYGFHDLRRGQAPYITSGVPEPFPQADTLDRYTVHHEIAEHPLVRRGKRLLDIGVGLGWTSLYFARAGYRVTAFEPSLGPVVAAKQYAIEQGIFVEYVCSALGFIAFRPDSFDVVTAFHSLHHVPDLERELLKVRQWLTGSGVIAIDEHVGNSRLAQALSKGIHEWAEREVLPAHRTIPPEVLARLPAESHSALEDASVEAVVPVVEKLFDVRLRRARHVFLDHYPFLYYLYSGRDVDAYRHSLTIADQMQEFVRLADPEGGDYITIVAERGVDEAEASRNGYAVPTLTEKHGPQAEEQDAVSAGAADRIADLETRFAEQAGWAHELESQLLAKNRELARLHNTLATIEKGRLFRLSRLLNRRKSQKSPEK